MYVYTSHYASAEDEVIWANKTSRSKERILSPRVIIIVKDHTKISVIIVKPGLVTLEKNVIIFKYICRNCGKERHVARKCMKKPQNVNAVDESGSACVSLVYFGQ